MVRDGKRIEEARNQTEGSRSCKSLKTTYNNNAFMYSCTFRSRASTTYSAAVLIIFVHYAA